MSGYGSMSGGEGQQEGLDKVKSDLAQKTGEVVDQAKEQTGQVVEQVRGNAFQMVDQQKHRAADSLGSVAQALRQTGDSLNGSEQGGLGQYAERAADAIEQFSSQLHDKSVEQLLNDAERFARREPELFLGGAVLLGLLASRFLKASSRRSQVRGSDSGEYGYGGQYGSGNYGQGQSGTGRSGDDRGTWGSENIGYRSAGTGGYRTTSSGSGYSTSGYSGSATPGAGISGAGTTGSSFFGETSTGKTSGETSLGNNQMTSWRPRSDSMETGSDSSSLRHDEDGSEGFNAGSSQA